MSQRPLQADLTYWSLKMSFFKGSLELLLLSPLEDRWQITVIVQSGLPYPVFTSLCYRLMECLVSSVSLLCLCKHVKSYSTIPQHHRKYTDSEMWTKHIFCLWLNWKKSHCDRRLCAEWLQLWFCLMSLCHLCPLVWRTESVCLCVCLCVVWCVSDVRLTVRVDTCC